MDKNEIICISSDDDESVEQNKTTSKQLSVIKQTGDKRGPQIKVEFSSGERKSTDTNQKKRKISEVISENDTCPEIKVKVIVCEEKPISRRDTLKDIDELPAVEKSDEEKSLLKPKLVIKEKKSVCLVEQDIFPMFISLCLQKDRSEDMKTVVSKLKRRYEQLDPAYANSEDFISFLNEKRNDIVLSKQKLYVHIAEVMTEMKSKRKGNSTTSLNGTNCASNVGNDSANALCSGTNSNVVNDGEAKSTTSDNEEKCNNTNRKIKMVSKAMKKCEKYIKRLEEAEVDFEHENNSNYIKLEKFKHRMVELYNKYCELTGESADAGRQYLRPKHLSMSGIVSVDHAITSFINSKISKRKKLKKIGAFTDALIFPDYRDILDCVTKCNEWHNLGLDNKKQQQIAKKAFIELGEHLQLSRRSDYWDTFSVYLGEKDNDPALKDSQLAEKLAQNKQDGDKRLANIFQEYVKKQEEMKDQASDTGTSTENEENEENEEDCEDDETEDINDITDNISEDGTGLNTDGNNASTDEDENGLDKSESSVNITDNNVEPSVKEVQPDVVETDEKCRLDVNNKLKTSVNNNVKLKQVDSDVNVSKSERAESIKEEKLPDTVLCNLNTTAPSDNKISIENIKEDEPILITDKLMNEQPTEEEEEEEEEEEDKPMLRVRSFAKLPGTWKDIQEKAAHLDNNNDLIDLTQESPKQNSIVHQQPTAQNRSRVSPCAKDKRRTMIIAPGKNIIQVKHITNCVRLVSKNSARLNGPANSQNKILTFKGKIEGSTAIRLPVNQQFNQKANDNGQTKGSRTKGNGITVQVPPSNQVVILLGKQKENTLQQAKVNVSVSQSK